MNTNDNVTFSYSFGAVLLEDAATLTETATTTVIYWDETESDTAVSDSDNSAPPPHHITRCGLNGPGYPQPSSVNSKQLPYGMTYRLAA